MPLEESCVYISQTPHGNNEFIYLEHFELANSLFVCYVPSSV